MDKDAILEKSRRENRERDEMERAVRIEGESFSLLLTLMMGSFLYLYNRLHGLPSGIIFIMFWTSAASNRLYRLTKRKDASDLITLLISLVILVFYMVQYLTQG